MNKLKTSASNNIEILGYQSFDVLREYMANCQAFIYAAEEDFGIAPVEAQACGTPVIAYGKGGVTETIISNKTGLFFYEQSASEICRAVKLFEKNRDLYIPKEIRRLSSVFQQPVFVWSLRVLLKKSGVNLMLNGLKIDWLVIIKVVLLWF